MRRPQRYGGSRGELAIVVDCRDLRRAARFWKAALDYVERDADANDSANDSANDNNSANDNDAESPYRSLVPADGDGIELLLQQVPDEKRQKNRLHLDLRTRDLEGELQRLLDLGASLLTEEPVDEEGWTWYILADPDGNEFCVVRPSAAYWGD